MGLLERTLKRGVLGVSKGGASDSDPILKFSRNVVFFVRDGSWEMCVTRAEAQNY